MRANTHSQSVGAHVRLASTGSPTELHVKLRFPAGTRLHGVTVNGHSTTPEGSHGDTLVIRTEGQQTFDISGQFS